jgi:4-diphosphocytidyl-2-C-methyl-D-erythritol kinase
VKAASCFAARAPAKINLTLQIAGRRNDGWHELHSLVAFAGAADHLTLAAGEPLSLVVDGPTATRVGPAADNLVLRAAGALAARVSGLRLGAFHLTKRLPVAAGIGGGSADAAAALRLLARANGLALDDPRLVEAAAATGADVPVCVAARARVMAGIGERLGPLLRLPPLFAVLVNPGVALETKPVFAKLGLAPGEKFGGNPHPEIADGLAYDDLLRLLNVARNDMQPAAEALSPVVGEVLSSIAALPDCRLARMSGSGATCVGLFDDRHAARRGADLLKRDHLQWWVTATLLR